MTTLIPRSNLVHQSAYGASVLLVRPSRDQPPHTAGARNGRARPVSVVYRFVTLCGKRSGVRYMARADEPAIRPSRRIGLLRAPSTALLIALALAVAGCGSDDGDASLPTTTTERRSTAATSTSTTENAAEVVVDRYLAFWEARLEANQAPPNPDHPALAEYATGRQLDNVVEETRQRRDEGLAIRRPENSASKRDVRVVSDGPEEVTLQDCSVNDGIIYRVNSGEVVNDDVVTQSIRATMRLVGGEWKLEQASLVQEWPGVAGCALAG